MTRSRLPPPDEQEEERLMLERAEEAFQRQLEREEGRDVVRSPLRDVFRWIILAIGGIALLLVLFTRLGQLT